MSEPGGMLRILAVGDVWQGSNAYGFIRAFRRMGHSVGVVQAEHFIPGGWTSRALRAARRVSEPVLVSEFARALVREAEYLDPHVLFVFKGRYVTAEAIQTIRERGAVAVNFFPDVSFMAHGKYIPRALPQYDWVFTSKSFGVSDMERVLGVRSASFLPHGYDPEVHRPITLGAEDSERYAADVSFIGTWSPKKQRFLEHLAAAMPGVRLRIWGSQWEGARRTLGARVEGRHILGAEYAKALVGSQISLAILSEARTGSSSGDLVTSRTFHIPATGSFMLHERSAEIGAYFVEGRECACFDSADELTAKVEHYLAHPDDRRAIAEAGLRRSLESGYAIDDRAKTILERVSELRRTRRSATQP